MLREFQLDISGKQTAAYSFQRQESYVKSAAFEPISGVVFPNTWPRSAKLWYSRLLVCCSTWEIGREIVLSTVECTQNRMKKQISRAMHCLLRSQATIWTIPMTALSPLEFVSLALMPELATPLDGGSYSSTPPLRFRGHRGRYFTLTFEENLG